MPVAISCTPAPECWNPGLPLDRCFLVPPQEVRRLLRSALTLGLMVKGQPCFLASPQ